MVAWGEVENHCHQKSLRHFHIILNQHQAHPVHQILTIVPWSHHANDKKSNLWPTEMIINIVFNFVKQGFLFLYNQVLFIFWHNRQRFCNKCLLREKSPKIGFINFSFVLLTLFLIVYAADMVWQIHLIQGFHFYPVEIHEQYHQQMQCIPLIVCS